MNIFHQLKAELRKGARVLIVGVDAGKSSSKACFYTFAHNVLLKKFHVAHTHEGFTSFIEKIEHLKATNLLDDVIIRFEPPGNYHKLPAEYLRKFGYYVVYVSSVAVPYYPNILERNIEEDVRRIKPMRSFRNDESCDRILYAIAREFNANPWRVPVLAQKPMSVRILT